MSEMNFQIPAQIQILSLITGGSVYTPGINARPRMHGPAIPVSPRQLGYIGMQGPPVAGYPSYKPHVRQLAILPIAQYGRLDARGPCSTLFAPRDIFTSFGLKKPNFLLRS